MGAFPGDIPTGCTGRRRPGAALACRLREAWQAPLPRCALNGCDGSRRPDALWVLPMEGGVAGPPPARYINWVSHYERARGCVGIADLRKRGREQSREMHQLGAPLGDDRRRRRRVDVGNRGWAPPARCTYWVCLQDTDRGDHGVVDVMRRDGIPPGGAPITCAVRRWPEAA